MNFIDMTDLDLADLRAIWSSVLHKSLPIKKRVAWSFEGNGIRTRTTFLQAFAQMGLSVIELPNLLKTVERVQDLAGYLDPFYDIYVIRETDHIRLAEFAACSEKPVINAMSSRAHPCEVLTDAYFIDSMLMPIEQASICLWGPPTNVLRSWHDLASLTGVTIVHVCDATFHEAKPHVQFRVDPPPSADVVITDSWPVNIEARPRSLQRSDLAAMGDPKLLPTPPFKVGQELDFDPASYSGFVGYKQKMWLLPVQIALMRYLLS